jgi:hypothetical protein
MRKIPLLAALGILAMTPAAASAHGHDPAPRALAPGFGVKIILHQAPKVVQHHHHPARHLRPQPWPRHFKHHAPRSSWHKPWHPGPRHFERQRGGHDRWFRGPDRRGVEQGHWKHRLHAPGPKWGPEVRRHRSFNHGRHDGHRRR